jgi:hypothetical protein
VNRNNHLTSHFLGQRAQTGGELRDVNFPHALDGIVYTIQANLASVDRFSAMKRVRAAVLRVPALSMA